ncbi:MAG: zinc ribbon domain-containing protein [Planctomycetes bacterium]|nr:zinc ribbon domain-containing protein [Planctomycetota bacterium]
MNPIAPEPQPDTPQAAPSAKVDFRCPDCGAPMTWNPDADALACEYCGKSMPVPRQEAQIVERPLEHAGAAARGLGVEVRAVRCGTCGAIFDFASTLTSASCVFCGSGNVLAQEANRNALRPESLIPLDVGREAAEASFKKWIRGLWFRPDALKELARFDAVGVYVPCWTFDANVHSDWSADAGYYYYETQMVPVMRNGRMRMEMRQVQKVRWVPAWGQRDDAYDDLLVHASKGLPEALAKKLGAFDTKALVPYRPEYLAGWRAEEYQLDLADAWTLAKERIVATQQSRCSGDVPGDTQRSLRVQNDVRDVRWKHILLPIWSLSYQHASKRYTVLIHGQNGRVEGEAPLSWLKILLLVFAILAGVLAIAAIAGLFAAVA